MTQPKPESIDNRGVPRKTYEAPRLEIYGNIQQITQALGHTGKVDGGTHNKVKTG
jgi:hypothetical protein